VVFLEYLNHEDASALVALGLHALQHRGQEGCGIVSFDGKNYHSEKRQGLVGDHFTIQKLKKTYQVNLLLVIIDIQQLVKLL
jgi:amidophosphoribosyltransferase